MNDFENFSSSVARAIASATASIGQQQSPNELAYKNRKAEIEQFKLDIEKEKLKAFQHQNFKIDQIKHDDEITQLNTMNDVKAYFKK